MRFYRYMVGVLLLSPFTVCVKGQTISCSSNGTNEERHYCEANARHGGHLVKQTSSVACVEGRTWGWDEAGIWVDQGCGGEFSLGKAERERERERERESRNNPLRTKEDQNASKADQRIRCESTDGRQSDCDADLKCSTVRLARQMGPSPCTEGSTWGYDDKEIWADRGCRGEFVAQRRKYIRRPELRIIDWEEGGQEVGRAVRTSFACNAPAVPCGQLVRTNQSGDPQKLRITREGWPEIL